MQYILDCFREVSKKIIRRKRFFFLLILLQLITIVIFSAFIFDSQLKIVEDIQNFITPFDTANYDATSLEEGQPFLDEPLKIYQAQLLLKEHLTDLLVGLVVLYLVLEGLVWLFSHRFLRKFSWKNTGRIYLKFLAFSIIFFGLISLSSYFIFNLTSLDLEAYKKSAGIFTLVFVVLYYFLFVNYALLPVVSWKLFFRKWFDIALGKISLTIPLIIIGLIVLGLIFAGMFYFIMYTQLVSVMILFLILFVIGLVFIRLAWIRMVGEL